MEVTGGNTTLAADIDDIKSRANAAFTESLKKVSDNKFVAAIKYSKDVLKPV